MHERGVLSNIGIISAVGGSLLSEEDEIILRLRTIKKHEGIPYQEVIRKKIDGLDKEREAKQRDRAGG